MPERKGTPKAVCSENRLRRYHARADKEEQLGRKLGSDEHVHHLTKNKTTVVSKKEHAKNSHGRGNHGPHGVYKK